MAITVDNILLQKTEHVARVAAGSRWHRLFRNPFRYSYAILLKNFLYPVFQKEWHMRCRLFTGQQMNILLPAATDIYLTGGKSHISEIKLARFLIRNLASGSTFWDVGAHYGYFTLLAAGIVGRDGHVLAIEAAPHTYVVLEENAVQYSQIRMLEYAVTDRNDAKVFFEMPNLYSEYNTTDIKQFEQESWFQKLKPKSFKVSGVTLDTLLEAFGQVPDIIKIDVEGGEWEVIKGGQKLLCRERPLVVMEYLSSQRHNQPHQKAAVLLAEWGYQPYVMEEGGSLRSVRDLEVHLAALGLESDNVVFKRD